MKIGGWFDKKYPKKFKVRIKLYIEGKERYTIQYCHYRFFKHWITINRWLTEVGVFNPYLLPVNEAEEKAREFKTYGDICAFNIGEQIKEVAYIKGELDRLEKINPFTTKEIL